MMVGSKDGASRGTKTLCRRIRALTNIAILDYESFSSVSCLGVLDVCLFISEELFWVRAKRDNYIWAFRELSDAVFLECIGARGYQHGQAKPKVIKQHQRALCFTCAQ